MARSRFIQAALARAAFFCALMIGARPAGAQDTPTENQDAPSSGASEAEKYRNPLGEQPSTAPAAPARAAAKRKPDFREMLQRGATQAELSEALKHGGNAAVEEMLAAADEEVRAANAKMTVGNALYAGRMEAAAAGKEEAWSDPELPEWLRVKYPDLAGKKADDAAEALMRRGASKDAKALIEYMGEQIKRRSEAIRSDAKRRIDRVELELGGELPSERLLRGVKDEFSAAGPWWLPPLGLFGGFVLVALGYGVWTLTRERRYWALAIGGALSLGGVWWSVAAVRHALKDQYAHTVQSVAMVAALIAGAAVCFFTWKLLLRPSIRKLKPDVLVEGQKGVLAECAHAADGSVWAGQVEGQSIYVTAEDRAVVIGPPGTGKTAFLVSQLLTWAEQKRSFVCLDSKPEIYGITRERLEAQGYRVLSYNPTSQTGQHYNLFDDIDGRIAIREIGAILIPAKDERNRVFADGARDLFDAIATHLMTVDGTVSFSSMRNWVMAYDTADELLKAVMQSPNEEVQELASSIKKRAVSDRLMASIFSTYDSGLTFVSLPEIRESSSRSDFSLGELCTDEPVALFLQFEESEREVTEHYLAAMVAHLLRFMIIHTDRPPVLLLLDEIGSVPVIPSLPQKLNTIRSRNLPTWLYWQSLEQMQKYGEKQNEGPNLILGATDVKVTFRLEDNNTAEWMSDRIGKIDRVIEAVSTKLGDMAQHTRQLSLEPMVFPRQLMELQPGQVVCSYRGHTWRGSATPHFERYPEFRGKRLNREAKRGPAYGRPSGFARRGDGEHPALQLEAE